MDQQFWHNAWARSDQPGWQQDCANEALQLHWRSDESLVFVPLCGRSPDLEWLHRQGHTVLGVELSEDAVIQFFRERQIDYSVSHDGDFSIYTAQRYRLYVGDYFRLTPDHLQGVMKVYDRAAMVAMSDDFREPYIEHFQHIVPAGAELFVVLLEYDQSLMQGPPFSVSESCFRQWFGSHYEITLLHSTDTDFLHRGVEQVTEKAYRAHCKKA